FHLEFPAFASDRLKALWPPGQMIVNFAHNEYLQVLAETGIAGFGLMAAVPIAFLRWLKERERVEGPELAAAALWAQNLLSPDLRFGLSSFMLFFCLGAALGKDALAHGAPPRPAPGPRRLWAALGAALIVFWACLAASPLLAERRLEREPDFHSP